MINEFLVNLLFAKIFVIGENEPHGRVVAGVNCHDTNMNEITSQSLSYTKVYPNIKLNLT